MSDFGFVLPQRRRRYARRKAEVFSPLTPGGERKVAL